LPAIEQDGVTTAPESTPYDPASHRWWQLRHSGAVVAFETSADGVVWNSVGTLAAPPFIDDGYIDLYAGTWSGTVAVPDTIVFTDLNLGLAAEPWCAGNTLHDDFSGPTLAVDWRRGGGAACAAAVSDSALHLTAPAEHDTRCFVETTRLYNLVESAVSAQVKLTPAGVGVSTVLFVQASDVWLEFGHLDDHLLVSGDCSGGASFYWTSATSIAGRNWIRIRQQAGQLYFETSTEGEFWQPAYSHSCSGSFDGVAVGLSLYFWNPNIPGTLTEAEFDHYNLAP
jgi:hypothetical protein